MPPHDSVGVHNDQRGAPIPPRVGEQHPQQSISGAELGALHGPLEHRQLLTERQILECDRSVSTTDQLEASEHDDEAASMSYPVPQPTTGINRGRRFDSGERQLSLTMQLGME